MVSPTGAGTRPNDGPLSLRAVIGARAVGAALLRGELAIDRSIEHRQVICTTTAATSRVLFEQVFHAAGSLYRGFELFGVFLDSHGHLRMEPRVRINFQGSVNQA